MPSLDYMVMHTGNRNIMVHCWIVVLLIIKQVAIQLPLLGCITKIRAGILLGKDAFDQLGCWQEYTNRIVYISGKSISDTT